jgi:beta-phosphoglucomutase
MWLLPPPLGADNFATMSDWPAAILFDFDGVIVNSEPLHFMAFREVLQAEGIQLDEAEYYRELIGFDDRGGFGHLYKLHNRPIDPKTLSRLMTRKSELVMELIDRRQYQALPGVEELIRGLWRHYPLAICSGALREEIEAMLQGVNLRDCFGAIVAAEDVQTGKPDPSGYMLAMRQVAQTLGKSLSPGDCLVVEDAPAVVNSTKGAGFSVLAVTTSHPAEKFERADWVVQSLSPHHVSKKIPRLKIKV